MNYLYRIRNDVIFDENDEKITVYGIDVLETTHNEEKTIKSVPDVFCSKSKAVTFIKLCNRLNLSPIHIMDVIDDIL